MKRVHKGATPRGLADFCDTNPGATWDGFRSNAGAGPNQELQARLREDQRGLCAYCERPLNGRSGTQRTEHLHPKAAAKAICRLGVRRSDWGTRWENLVAVCNASFDGRGCDHVKADRDLCGEILNPVTMPSGPVFSVRADGRLVVRADSPEQVHDQARRSLDETTLDLCRLSLRRDRRRELANLRQTIDELIESGNETRAALSHAIEKVVEDLFPEPPADWPKFFTAIRAELGTAAERRLSALSEAW